MKNNKKILISANTYWNIFNFRFDLLKYLKDQGYEIHSIAKHDSYKKYLSDIGINTINLNLSRNRTNIFLEFIILIKFFYLLLKIKPDLFIGYTFKPNIYGSIASKLLKIPTINNITGLGYVFINKNLFTFFFKIILKVSLFYSNAIIFQNKDDQNYFIKNKLCKKEKSFLIHGSGIDTKKYNYCPLVKNKKYIFLFIGRLIEDKGIFEFLEATNMFKFKNMNIKFQIIGEIDNEYLNKKKITINFLKNYDVEYLGFVNNIKKYIENADCIVLPSYREGLPKSLIEACAVGRPIIATDVPGCRSVVQNNYNGLLCKVKNSEDLFIKMEQMYNYTFDSKLVFSLNSRKLAEKKFDTNNIIKEYNVIIKKII